MRQKHFALVFAAAILLATTAVGGIVVADTSSATSADAQSSSETPTDSSASTIETDSPITAKRTETEVTNSETFPASIETVIYEEADGVTFVTKDTRFTMDPTVVGYAGGNASVPEQFDFTPMMKIGLNATEPTRVNDSTDGVFKMELPDDVEPEPVREFDPDVPVSNPPEEIEYEQETGTLTVVTSNGTTDLAVSPVTDNGTIEYQTE